jgi:hypothetical protein
MATVQRFEELKVWQTAFQLDKQVWELVNSTKFSQDPSLRDQLFVQPVRLPITSPKNSNAALAMSSVVF